MKEITCDTFFNGTIQVSQLKEGYRFSIDAVLLSHFPKLKDGDKIVDLGTGCGIIPLILSYRNPNIKITGIELQTELFQIATHNIIENKIQNIVSIHCMDIKALEFSFFDKHPDMIITNPPYIKQSSGKINPQKQKAIARHEIEITLEELIKTVNRILRIYGRFVTIYPAERLADIIFQMRKYNIEPKNIRAVHSYCDADAKLILIEGTKDGGPGLKILKPLIIYEKNGEYTDEVKNMFKP
ncbi:MAG: tRNA1(Val) (adenine(37)-N6)-methyltransferase [Desulfobacterales bacterium]|nr:tRNA1(Val) (adenine(37)-N6)-methyltransferase [Desulfobacterales bacterium]